MSGLSDVSTARRLQTLYDRVADLERQLEGLSQVSAAPAAPRDVWLARTVANGQTYPTSGNTFFVELIRADFSTSAGDTEVTEYRRGTIVAARTWPDAYVPEDSQVVVMRIRGKQGPGEWWIETHSVDLSTMWGALDGGYTFDDAGVITGGASSWSQELLGYVLGPAVVESVGGGIGVGGVDRMQVSVPGLYSISAWAHVRLRMQPASGGGYSPQYASLMLSALQNGGSEVARGETQITSNAHDGRATVHMANRIRCAADDDPLQLWISGADGSWAAGNLTVWRWQMTVVRLGD